MRSGGLLPIGSGAAKGVEVCAESGGNGFINAGKAVGLYCNCVNGAIDGNLAISIDETGRITADGEEVATLQLVDFENYDYLEKFGENMYIAINGATNVPASDSGMPASSKSG